MTPSYSCLAFSSTLSRRVVPYFSRLTNPASSYSSESPSPNFESATSNACMEAAMISGPIPSHGKTRSFIAYPHTVPGGAPTGSAAHCHCHHGYLDIQIQSGVNSTKRERVTECEAAPL